jgi:hypothetical protein
MDQETRERLRAQHPGALAMHTPHGLVVLRRPTVAEYARFKAAALDEKRRSTAVEAFVSQCVVYPAPDAFEAIRAMAPALPDELGGRLLEHCGAQMAVEVEQL